MNPINFNISGEGIYSFFTDFENQKKIGGLVIVIIAAIVIEKWYANDSEEKPTLLNRVGLDSMSPSKEKIHGSLQNKNCEKLFKSSEEISSEKLQEIAKESVDLKNLPNHVFISFLEKAVTNENWGKIPDIYENCSNESFLELICVKNLDLIKDMLEKCPAFFSVKQIQIIKNLALKDERWDILKLIVQKCVDQTRENNLFTKVEIKNFINKKMTPAIGGLLLEILKKIFYMIEEKDILNIKHFAICQDNYGLIHHFLTHYPDMIAAEDLRNIIYQSIVNKILNKKLEGFILFQLITKKYRSKIGEKHLWQIMHFIADSYYGGFVRFLEKKNSSLDLTGLRKLEDPNRCKEIIEQFSEYLSSQEQRFKLSL